MRHNDILEREWYVGCPRRNMMQNEGTKIVSISPAFICHWEMVEGRLNGFENRNYYFFLIWFIGVLKDDTIGMFTPSMYIINTQCIFKVIKVKTFNIDWKWTKWEIKREPNMWKLSIHIVKVSWSCFILLDIIQVLKSQKWLWKSVKTSIICHLDLLK